MSHYDKNDTYNKIIEILADKLKTKRDAVSRSTKFQELGADSLDMVEIIMQIEEQFGIEVKDEDAEKLTTIGEAVDYVHEQRTKQQ